MNQTTTITLVDRLSALADPTRLRLLLLMEREELGVAELCEILQLPQSTVSRHLKVLGGQNWVVMRRHGTSHRYRMVLGELPGAARRLWTATREETSATDTARQDALRLEEHLARRQDGSEVFFAGAAASWADVRAETYGREIQAAALATLLSPDWIVADLGCGTGLLTRELAHSVGRVIGVDSSPAMLSAARRTTSQLDNVDLRPGSLQALPIEDGTCDAALLILTLTYVAQPHEALSEAARILRRGGRMVVIDLLPHEREDFRREMGHASAGLDPEEILASLEQAGMSTVIHRALPPDPKATGPALFVASGHMPE